MKGANDLGLFNLSLSGLSSSLEPGKYHIFRQFRQVELLRLVVRSMYARALNRYSHLMHSWNRELQMSRRAVSDGAVEVTFGTASGALAIFRVFAELSSSCSKWVTKLHRIGG